MFWNQTAGALTSISPSPLLFQLLLQIDRSSSTPPHAPQKDQVATCSTTLCLPDISTPCYCTEPSRVAVSPCELSLRTNAIVIHQSCLCFDDTLIEHNIQTTIFCNLLSLITQVKWCCTNWREIVSMRWLGKVKVKRTPWKNLGCRFLYKVQCWFWPLFAWLPSFLFVVSSTEPFHQ